MSATEVILVDPKDRPIGRMEKLEAHQKGLLHRAMTVYVFNSRCQLLLQQRAVGKYHSGGLWSNTTCGHPVPGEPTQDAAERRLWEEMGMRLKLHPVFELSYNLPMSNGLSEHEYGHVFFAFSEAQPRLNPAEADSWRYATLPGIQQEMQQHPQQFTPWFLHTFPRVLPALQRFIAQQSR